MAAKTATLATGSGAVVTYFTPTETTGDTFDNTGKSILLVKNDSGSPITVTIAAPAAAAGSGLDDAGGGSVGAGEERAFGLFPTSRFANPVTFICSAVTDVTAAVIKTA